MSPTATKTNVAAKITQTANVKALTIGSEVSSLKKKRKTPEETRMRANMPARRSTTTLRKTALFDLGASRTA